jgi:DNA-binding NarL/FixJ family response regulator
MSKTIRVIVADDHPLIRTGIRLVLAETADIEVVGEARNGAEAIEKAQQIPADIILLDVSMPGLGALEVVQTLQENVPTLKIVIVSAYDDMLIVQALINAGVVGYLLKDEAEASLVSMIRTVHQGATWLSPGIIETLSPSVPALSSKVDVLTDRERDVLQALVQGATNHEIARQFQLADQTVRNYTSRIYEKLEITSRAEAIVWAFENGFSSTPGEKSPQRQSNEVVISVLK